jgi:hypothetical protein
MIQGDSAKTQRLLGIRQNCRITVCCKLEAIGIYVKELLGIFGRNKKKQENRIFKQQFHYYSSITKKVSVSTYSGIVERKSHDSKFISITMHFTKPVLKDWVTHVKQTL